MRRNAAMRRDAARSPRASDVWARVRARCRRAAPRRYHDHNPKKALELAAHATVANDYTDWWWKERCAAARAAAVSCRARAVCAPCARLPALPRAVPARGWSARGAARGCVRALTPSLPRRLGKCYFQLGLYRDAEKQFRSALGLQETVLCQLELARVYLRLDQVGARAGRGGGRCVRLGQAGARGRGAGARRAARALAQRAPPLRPSARPRALCARSAGCHQPNAALEVYAKAAESFPGEVALLVGQARTCDALNDATRAVSAYKRVLQLDATHAEAIASLAAHHFYTDQPELALRFYRRLLQLGVHSTEVRACGSGAPRAAAGSGRALGARAALARAAAVPAPAAPGAPTAPPARTRTPPLGGP